MLCADELSKGEGTSSVTTATGPSGRSASDTVIIESRRGWRWRAGVAVLSGDLGCEPG
jgi:hypothetical protein